MAIRNKVFKFLLKHPKSKILHSLLSEYSNNGLAEDEGSDKDYVFGLSGEPEEILQPDGQWVYYLPEAEDQKGRLVETMACVSYSFLNATEILFKRKWNESINKSDRYLAKLSGTSTRGNTQRNVGDAYRLYGMVDEHIWPYDRETFTWNEFYKVIPNEIIAIGQKELVNYSIEYKIVENNKRALMSALKYSPLWIAGYAWYKQGIKYVSYGTPNHAFVLVGYKENEYWLAFDTYSPHVKMLDWNFDFIYPKTVHVIAKDLARKEREQLLNKGIKYIMRTDSVNGGRGQVYEIKPEGLDELDQDSKMKPEDRQNFMNNWVREQLKAKILTGINEELFSKMK
jgi:hypothetical protein